MQSSKKINNFLKKVCDQIRWKKAHEVVSKEIEDHIIDQKNGFISLGMDEQTAIDKAIKEMGDPVLIGTELDSTHRPKTEWSIILLTGVMILLGFGMRLLVSFDTGFGSGLEKSVIITVIGICFMIAFYLLDFTTIGKYPKSIFIFLAFITIGIALTSPIIYSQRWYVPFMLLLFPTAFAGIIYNMRTKGYMGIIYSGLFFAIPLFIALTSASTASVILYSLSCLILLTIAIAKGWFNVNKLKALLLVYIPTTILSSTVFLVAVVNNSYRMKMFLNIIDPASDKMGSGWIVTNIREILASSKLIGQNKAIEASLILPEINTNYILTFLIHRLGWLAFLVVVGVVTTFIVRSFILSSKQKSMLGTLISTSVLITFTMQVVFYIISNLGIVLIAPLALPFIAYSGSSIVINMILIGIMLSVFKSGDLVKDNLLERQGRRDKFFEVVDGKIIIDLNLK